MFSKPDEIFTFEKKGWKKDFKKKLVHQFYNKAYVASSMPNKNALLFSEAEDSDSFSETDPIDASFLSKLGYSKKDCTKLNPSLIGFLEQLISDTFNDIDQHITNKYPTHTINTNNQYQQDKLLFKTELIKSIQDQLDFFFAILLLEQDLHQSKAHSNLVKYGFLIVKRSHRAVKNNDINADDLPKLTKFLQDTRLLLEYQTLERLESFKTSLIHVYAINSSYAEIIGEVGLGFFGMSLVITALMTGLFLFCFASSMTAAVATTYGLFIAFTGGIGSASIFSATYFGSAIIEGSIYEAGSDFKHVAKYTQNTSV